MSALLIPGQMDTNCYDPLFSFHITLVSDLLSTFVPFRTVPSEHPQPKHSFPFTHYAWSRCPVPNNLLWTSSLVLV